MYQKQNFEADQILTAAHLNHMEEGIAKAAVCLKVMVEGDEADHTSSEIYDHVANNRGPVQLHCDGMCYALLCVEAGGCAYFGCIADELLMKVVLIGDDDVERYEHQFDSPQNVDAKISDAIGDISTALNHIIELQEELIGT